MKISDFLVKARHLDHRGYELIEHREGVRSVRSRERGDTANARCTIRPSAGLDRAVGGLGDSGIVLSHWIDRDSEECSSVEVTEWRSSAGEGSDDWGRDVNTAAGERVGSDRTRGEGKGQVFGIGLPVVGDVGNCHIPCTDRGGSGSPDDVYLSHYVRLIRDRKCPVG